MPTPSAPLASKLRRLERLGVALILLAALVPRLRDFTASFDRGFEGEQNAFFAIGAINYERLGLWRAGGYPILNIDLGDRAAPEHGIWNRSEAWYVYANHPPAVPLLAWFALKALAPEDWNGAWHEGRSAQGLEAPLRLPFLVLHVAGLLAFWWALRQAWSAQRALLALALLAACPVSVIYATLANYENPALLFVFLALGFYARFLRSGGRRELAGCALSFAAGSCVTYAGMFFLPALALHALLSRRPRRAWSVAWAGAAAGLAPLLLHGAWARHALAKLGQTQPELVERARTLLEPLFDGAHPPSEWLGLQVERLGTWCTPTLLALAAAGLAWSALATFVPSLRHRLAPTREGADAAQPNLALPLLLGGALYLFAFYRHTLDPQFPFLMLVAPGLAACAALALDAASPLLLRLRAGFSPLVLVACTIAVVCAQRFNGLRRELREEAASLEQLPLPAMSGSQLRELLPAGSFAVHPSRLGLNLAASFYAWRSLWPIQGPADPTPSAVAERVGLGRAAHYLVLPNAAPPGAAEQCAELRRALAGDAQPERASERWSVWRIP
jgi:dolichyl-phosphate-mannose-protein mannosyltransferase